MQWFDYRAAKKLDAQRRMRSLARYEQARLLRSDPPAPPVADVIDMTFPEECPHEERLGA